MKVLLSWLKDYVDIKLPIKELAEKLTMAGLEVKEIQTIGHTWNDVVVGEVMDLKPHPNADRLKVATVNLGTEQVTVVCGAPNISVGQKVPLARIGAEITNGRTGKPVAVKATTIRGVLSQGMICSEKELGISEDHEGIMVLPSEAPVGVPLGVYLRDAILDVDITPNRPDCLSVTGIAREVAALTGQPLRLPDIHYQEEAEPIATFVSVTVADPELCPRYCASLVTGIKVAPSPRWLQQRLSSCGIRSINNVVDITNYVMMEYGQPLHAFDFNKVQGGRIIVRRAKDREKITTLDGVERTLDPEVLVIADMEKPVAIAGIMGGLDSEVIEKTDTVLLESANFNWAAIRRACARLQLYSEASTRFDKGLNSELPLLPLKRATQLLSQLASGKVCQGIIDVYPGKSEAKPILLDPREIKRLSGLEVNTKKTIQVLTKLGFDCHQKPSTHHLSVFVPYWRSDIRCPADLVEEVVRIVGYDKIPATMLSSSLPQQEPPSSLPVRRRNLRKKIQHLMVACGFQEILTYSLVSLEKLQKLSPKRELKIAPLRVANPMTREQEYLRTTLRAGVLSTLAHNQKFEPGGIRLFEIGKVFLPQAEDLPEEKEMLCAVLSGRRKELCWQESGDSIDFFDAKGVVECLLNHLGIKARFQPGDDEGLFPGRQANITVEHDHIGVVGDLHPKVMEAFELARSTCLIEIDLEKLLRKIPERKEYHSIPRFPAVYRDIALVVDEQTGYTQIEETIQSFPLIVQTTLFDVYRGEQIPRGKKSFAIRIVYQSPTHTLTDEEVDRVQEQMLARLKREFGATLRA